MSAGNILKKATLPTPATSPATGFGNDSNHRRVVKRAVIAARIEARRIVADAEAKAAAIHANAEANALELREAAYREGLETALLELNEHLLETREKRDTALASVERDILQLAVKIAEKIIGHEIERNNSVLADIVTAALRHARRQEMLVVRVNPSDLTIIEAHRERLDAIGHARFLDIVSDPRVRHGGCIIESDSGTVDAQLDTQLCVLERALLARMSASHS